MSTEINQESITQSWFQKSRQHFLKVAPAYDNGRSFERGQFWAKEVSTLASLTERDLLLDIGCGTGLFTAAFAKHLRCHIVAIDPSPIMLQVAKGKDINNHVYWLQGTAETLPLPTNSSQCVFISQVWHHITDKKLAARECYRILKPGGVMLVKTYSHEQLLNRWDIKVVFPELMAFMLKIYDDIPDFDHLLKGKGFKEIQHKDFRKEDVMRPSTLFDIADKRLWSMFSFISEKGRKAGMDYLRELTAQTGDAPVPYDEIHHLVIARK